MTPEEKIIVALDGLHLERTRSLVYGLGERPYCFKIHDLWDSEGPDVLRKRLLEGKGYRDERTQRFWVDLKLKDIPYTVGLRAKAVYEAGADILTVHASGGIEMMMAAVKHGPPEIYAVTILTSLGEEEVHLLHGQPAKAAALYQARLAKLAGVHGIVCSPKEVGFLAKQPELQGMKFVTPGIRPVGKEAADQKRTDTPVAALKAGATHLVIGRAITEASDPVAAFEAIAAEIAEAEKGGD